ncbi:MAG TPA: ribonuclease HII [Candidatus Absconditabacterales bacterium]|nr:ribonuclease HII [Candidatus Absconditabacterales bacterium]HOQ78977.1 ribonuclease HII [Candidatus Absconditabacterales bacterium]HPK28073.1 ribonuclease HII [Candidatus Absconditabacterales bacterium]
MEIYVDEAGRGPLAGPLHVGLILVLKQIHKKKFKDSKQLSSSQREKLFEKIKELEQKGSLLYSIGTVNNQEIDNLGLTKAISLAIKRGLFELLKKYYQNFLQYSLSKGLCSCDLINKFSIENLLHNKFSITNLKNLLQIISQTNPIFGMIIDGKQDFGVSKDLEIKTKTVVKGDIKVHEISMASIVAKVSRDNRMIDCADKKYPQYNFKKHKGYGTKEHISLIKKFGICKLHRKSFLKKI